MTRLRRWITTHADLVGCAWVVGAFVAPLFSTAEPFVGSRTDMLSMQLPLHEFAMEWMRRGVLPLWNPHLFGGVPFQAGAHGYLYPGWWTGLILPAELDIKVGIWLHLSLAALGGAYFARGRVRSRWASALAGITFALSAFFAVHLFAGHRVMLATAAWLPWLAGGLDRMLRGRGGRATAIASAGLMWLAAHYQMIFISLGGVLLFFLLEALCGERSWTGPRWREAGRRLLRWGVLAMAGALLAAVQVLPALRTASLSQRAEGGPVFAASFSSAPANLWTYLIPDLFGNRFDAPHIGAWSYWESLGYVGLLPLGLVLFACVVLPWRRWLPAALVMGLALLVAQGAHTAFFRFYLMLVPGAELFRAPGRACLLVTWLAGWLAAMALDAWLGGRIGRARFAAGVASVALLAAATGALLPGLDPADPAGLQAALTSPDSIGRLGPQGLAQLDVRGDTLVASLLLATTTLLLLAAGNAPRRGGLVAALLLALHAGDLFRFGQRFLVTAPAASFEIPAAAVELVRREAGPAARIITEGPWPDLPVPHGIGTPGGFDIFVDQRYARYLNRSQQRPLDYFFSRERNLIGSPLIRHLGVPFLLASQPLRNGWNDRFRDYPWFEPVGRVDRVFVHRDLRPAPRATLVHRVELAIYELEAYRRMESPDFDLRRVALLDAEPPAEFAQVEPAPPGARERASIVRYEPNRVEIEVQAATAAVLVLSDVLQPGWRARVDGQPAPLVHANRVMRAVPVPPGSHRVVMTYLPRTFVLGALVSAIALASLLGLQLRGRRRSGPPGPSATLPA